MENIDTRDQGNRMNNKLNNLFETESQYFNHSNTLSYRV